MSLYSDTVAIVHWIYGIFSSNLESINYKDIFFVYLIICSRVGQFRLFQKTMRTDGSVRIIYKIKCGYDMTTKPTRANRTPAFWNPCRPMITPAVPWLPILLIYIGSFSSWLIRWRTKSSEYCWRYRADTIPSTLGWTKGRAHRQHETSIPHSTSLTKGEG